PHPVLPLGLRTELHSIRVSVDTAGQRKVRADFVSEGVWRFPSGPRWGASQHQNQVPGAYGRGYVAVAGGRPVAFAARRPGIRVGEKLLPAARSAVAAVRVQL